MIAYWVVDDHDTSVHICILIQFIVDEWMIEKVPRRTSLSFPRRVLNRIVHARGVTSRRQGDSLFYHHHHHHHHHHDVNTPHSKAFSSCSCSCSSSSSSSSSSSPMDTEYYSPGNTAGDGGQKKQKNTAEYYKNTYKRGGTAEQNFMRLLWCINESTKWVVSALVFGILLGKRDETTAWCIIGGVITAILCRVLKFIIQASRPSSSVRSDPGMPSSHASTLAFLSAFPSLMVLEGHHGLSSFLLAWSLPMGGIFLTSLRVILGYHTVPQVVVGWLLGTTMAYVWLRVGVDLALPYLMSSMMGRLVLTVSTFGFMALFAVKNVLRWMKE